MATTTVSACTTHLKCLTDSSHFMVFSWHARQKIIYLQSSIVYTFFDVEKSEFVSSSNVLEVVAAETPYPAPAGRDAHRAQHM